MHLIECYHHHNPHRRVGDRKLIGRQQLRISERGQVCSIRIYTYAHLHGHIAHAHTIHRLEWDADGYVKRMRNLEGLPRALNQFVSAQITLFRKKKVGRKKKVAPPQVMLPLPPMELLLETPGPKLEKDCDDNKLGIHQASQWVWAPAHGL